MVKNSEQLFQVVFELLSSLQLVVASSEFILRVDNFEKVILEIAGAQNEIKSCSKALQFNRVKDKSTKPNRYSVYGVYYKQVNEMII